MGQVDPAVPVVDRAVVADPAVVDRAVPEDLAVADRAVVDRAVVDRAVLVAASHRPDPVRSSLPS